MRICRRCTHGRKLTSFLAVFSFSLLCRTVDVSAGAGLTDEEREDAQLSLTPHDILRKLPGVTATNIRGLLQQVNNLRELSEATLKQLTQWMGGAAAAKKLYTFMHGQTHAEGNACSHNGMRWVCVLNCCACTACRFLQTRRRSDAARSPCLSLARQPSAAAAVHRA